MKRRQRHARGALTEVERLRAQLEALYLRSDPRTVSDPELAADLGQFLCVRVSGYLEQATTEILTDYCAKHSWGGVQSFALSWLEKSPNLRREPLVRLVGRFDEKWARELDAFLDEDERGSVINALVGARNDIAHGKQQKVSRDQAWGYYEVVEAIVQWLLDKFFRPAVHDHEQDNQSKTRSGGTADQ